MTIRAAFRHALTILLWFWMTFIGALHAAESSTELKFTVATTHPPSLPWVSVIRDHVIPEFDRRLAVHQPETKVHWTPAWGTLYKWHDSLHGVETGLADIGWVGSLWESSQLPLQNITYALPFITDDLSQLLRVMNSMHQSIPAMRQAWERYNIHFLGVSGVDTYHLLTTFPVRTLDDLKGKKILAPGAAAIWLKGTGAVAVDGALTTYYTQLKTGVADGVLSILTGAHPFRIHEVAPYITLVGIGAQCTGALTANAQSFARLPPIGQTILEQLGEEYSMLAAADVEARYARTLEALAVEGAKISTLPLAEKRRWIDGLPPLSQLWVQRLEAKGLPAAQVLKELMQGLRRAGVTPQRDWDYEIVAHGRH